MAINTVQDLINALNEVEDKTKPVFGYITTDKDETYEVVQITMVDNSISDRVDINLHISGDEEE
jgi:hypothetical protein